jgi:hypothetical protein
MKPTTFVLGSLFLSLSAALISGCATSRAEPFVATNAENTWFFEPRSGGGETPTVQPTFCMANTGSNGEADPKYYRAKIFKRGES